MTSEDSNPPKVMPKYLRIVKINKPVIIPMADPIKMFNNFEAAFIL